MSKKSYRNSGKLLIRQMLRIRSQHEKRLDERGLDEIRPIEIELDVIKKTSGSGLGEVESSQKFCSWKLRWTSIWNLLKDWKIVGL